MQLRARFLAAALSISAVFAQDNNYTAGLTAALNGAGLTALAGVLGSAPPELVSALQQGNHTVFAPSNEALGSIDPAALGSIGSTLSYHVTAGVVDESSLANKTTVVRTVLTGAPLVLLPGNQTQVVVVNGAPDGTLQIDNAGRNVSVTGNATYQNLHVWVIDAVLTIPQNLTAVVTSTPDLSALATAAGTIPGLVPALTATRGLTLFAPVNSAFTAVMDQLASANETVVTNVLKNHLINGTAVYSSQVTDGASLTSAGGEELKFTSNSTGIFVTSGNSTAKVIRPNVLTSNGVVHLIDQVLLNAESNPAAASSAVASLSSAQATNSPAETGPVTSASAGIQKVDISLPFKVIMGLFAGSILGAGLL